MSTATRLRFRKALIATGARPDTPSIPGLVEAGYLTNENVFDLTELPRRLLVIGGGPLGCELAQAFCRFGARTTIAQSLPLFLPKEERDAAQLLSDAFARDGIDVRLNTKPSSVRIEGGEKLVDLVSDDYREHGGRRCNPDGHRPLAQRRATRTSRLQASTAIPRPASASTISCKPPIRASTRPATLVSSTSSTHTAEASARIAVA